MLLLLLLLLFFHSGSRWLTYTLDLSVVALRASRRSSARTNAIANLAKVFANG